MKASRFFLIFLILIILGCDYKKGLIERESLPPESFFALNDWTAQRAQNSGAGGVARFDQWGNGQW